MENLLTVLGLVLVLILAIGAMREDKAKDKELKDAKVDVERAKLHLQELQRGSRKNGELT